MSQFYRNSTLLIGKLSVATDATSLADLAEGEINVVDAATGAIVAAGKDITDYPAIKIVRGGASSAHQFSAPIKGTQVKKWTGNSYAAPTQQVDTITMSATPVPSGYTAILSIVLINNKVWGSQRQDRHTYQIVGSGTPATDATALAALVNADTYMSGLIVASTNSADLILTAQAQTYNSLDGYDQVIFDSFLESRTSAGVTYSKISRVATTKPVQGVGAPSIIRTMERDLKPLTGLDNFRAFPVKDATTATNTETTATYDVYVIEHDDVHPDANLNGQIASPLRTIIAIPSANTTVTTAIEGVLNPYFASCPGVFADVNL